jgi:hypothetical protein
MGVFSCSDRARIVAGIEQRQQATPFGFALMTLMRTLTLIDLVEIQR